MAANTDAETYTNAAQNGQGECVQTCKLAACRDLQYEQSGDAPTFYPRPRRYDRLYHFTFLFLAGAIMAFAAANIVDPYLVPLRPWGPAIIIATTIGALAVIRRRHWCNNTIRIFLLAIWYAVPLTLVIALATFYLRKHNVLAETGPEVQGLGRHFVVGYTDVGEVERLAAKGMIGGIFVTARNAHGKTAAELRAEIARLQGVRKQNGLPPLIVATDQEGGIVSRLTPPLTKLPWLASTAQAPADQRAAQAHDYGLRQGKELAAIGITVNFSPVLDLSPAQGTVQFDRNSQIERRAISADPRIVGEIGLAYTRGLEEAGVSATLKHFPGLGRVTADTHHFRVGIPTSKAELEASDWLPFRKIASDTNTLLMIGHVTLSAIDPDHPASYSQALIEGVLRGEWGYHGIIITDDMVMSPIYQYDLCGAVSGGLNGGVDLLLVAFDGQQYYRTMRCALDAFRRGQLDASKLATSDRRLDAKSLRASP
jgi:beta-N-acetylhexosaminidase